MEIIKNAQRVKRNLVEDEYRRIEYKMEEN
jgi:hypothetical protein